MRVMKGAWVGGALLAGGIITAIAMAHRAHTAAPLEHAHKAANAAQLRAARLALPKELSGVYLGMDLAELRRARPAAKVNAEAEEPLYFVYDERLPSKSRAVYQVRKSDLALEKLQVASQLPGGVDDIEARVAAHSARYGAVTGIWDCPDRGRVYLATRRFTWQVEDIALMDVYLIIGENVSATLYAAPQAAIVQSLKGAACVATHDNGLTSFPVPAATVKR
jgi:hypothetical protein